MITPKPEPKRKPERSSIRLVLSLSLRLAEAVDVHAEIAMGKNKDGGPGASQILSNASAYSL